MNQIFSRVAPVVFCLFLSAAPFAASALDIRSGERIFFKSADSVGSDLYIAAGEVESSGEVRGDLSAVGGKVRVDGPVWIDLSAAGGEVMIEGDVGDDVRAVGGRVEVRGYVRGDAVLGGGEVRIGGKGVGGDAVLGGGSVRIDAPVAGSVRIGGADVVINSAISGDVRVSAEKLTLGPGAVLSGDLTYTAASEVAVEEGAVVEGQVTYTKHSYALEGKDFSAIFTLWMLSKLLMILVGALALFFFFPRYAGELARVAGSEAMPSLGIGLVFLVAIPIISIMLLLTLIGLPLGALGLLSYFAAIVFACIGAPIVVGSYLHHWISRKGHAVTWQTVIYGVMLYFILTLVPIVGPLIKFIAFLITLGAILSINWSIAKGWRY